MNWVDGAVVGVVALSALLAFMRGLVRELFGIGAWVGAFFFTIYTVDLVRDRITKFVGSPDLGTPLAYAAMFLPALIVLSMITHTLANLVRESALGSLDRTLGIGFGVARAAFLVAAAYVFLGWVFPNAENWPEVVRQARTVPWAHELAAKMLQYLPKGAPRPGLVEPPAQRETKAAGFMQATPQGRATAPP